LEAFKIASGGFATSVRSTLDDKGKPLLRYTATALTAISLSGDGGQ